MPNVSVLCEETLWPIENDRLDKLVLMHGLETSERPSPARGMLARAGARWKGVVHRAEPIRALGAVDETPFGYGRPYSMGQLEAQLKAHYFDPLRHIAVLYQPPSTRRFWMKTGPVLGKGRTERVRGRGWWCSHGRGDKGPPQTERDARGKPRFSPLGNLVPTPRAKPARARVRA